MFNRVASWALTCRRCGEVFTHHRLSDTLVAFFTAEKPKFPTEGLECECPNCHAKSFYFQHELIYLEE